MSNRDAEDRFRYAVKAFKKADDQARTGYTHIDVQAFKMVIIDLDAAIPGLDGEKLGAALVFKAHCLYWLFRADMHTSRFFDVDKAANSPLRKDGLALALKGRQILQDLGSTQSVAWADDLIKFLNN